MRESYREYAADPSRFADDSWPDKWSMEFPYYSKAESWVNDPRELTDPRERELDASMPASTWSRACTIETLDSSRRGLLLAGAPSLEVPFAMSRTVKLPKCQSAKLYVGVARRRGCHSLLRIRVNDRELWQHALDDDGWVHQAVDLTAWQGQEIRVSVESDADGNRGMHEVLFDYVLLSVDGQYM